MAVGRFPGLRQVASQPPNTGIPGDPTPDPTPGEGEIVLSLSLDGSNVVATMNAAPLSGRSVTGYILEYSLNGLTDWIGVELTEVGWTSALPSFNTATPNKVVDPLATANGTTIFNTIQAACDTMNPGDVIGIYNPWTYNEKVQIRRSGTLANPIYVQKLYQNEANPSIDGVYAIPGPPGDGIPYATDPDAMLGPYPTRASYGSWENTEYNASMMAINASYVTWDSIDVLRSHQIGAILGPLARTNGYFVWDAQEAYVGIKVLRSKLWGSRGLNLNVYGGGVYLGGCSLRESNAVKFYDRLTPVNQFDWGNAMGLNGPNITITECEIFQTLGEGGQISAQINTVPALQPIPRTCTNLTFTRNKVWDTWSSLLYFWDADNATVEQNLFYMTQDTRFWHYGSSPHALLDFGSESDTYGNQTPQDGIVGARNVKVRNNVFTGGERLVTFSEWASQQCNNIDFSNNTLFRTQGNTGYRTLLVNTQTTLQNLALRNNVFYEVNGDVVGNDYDGFITPGGTFTKQTNLWSHTPPANMVGTGDIVNLSVGLTNPAYAPPTDPWPNIPAAFDTGAFKLLETSPAVNAGTVIEDLTVDFFGNPRPTSSGKYDIGAHSLSKPNIHAYTVSIDSGVKYFRARFKDSTQATSSNSDVKSITVP